MTVKLSSKFDKYIINDLHDAKLSSEVSAARNELNNIYSNQANMAPDCNAIFSSALGFQQLEGTPHVVSHPKMNKWVFKCKRSDMQTSADTHLYRVRKADKIRRMNLAGVIVPQKYLYRLPNGEYIILAQKMTIHREVANPALLSQDTPDWFRDLIPKTVYIKLTPSQGKNVVRVIFRTNSTDLNRTNVYHDENNQLVLPDTEPHLRYYRKMAWRWIPGASSTFSHMLGVVVVQSLAKQQDFSTKVSMHFQKTVELGRYLVGLIARIALTILVSKGASHMADNSTNLALKAVCSIVNKAAKVNQICLITLGALSVLMHLIFPIMAYKDPF